MRKWIVRCALKKYLEMIVRIGERDDLKSRNTEQHPGAIFGCNSCQFFFFFSVHPEQFLTFQISSLDFVLRGFCLYTSNSVTLFNNGLWLHIARLGMQAEWLIKGDRQKADDYTAKCILLADTCSAWNWCDIKPKAQFLRIKYKLLYSTIDYY